MYIFFRLVLPHTTNKTSSSQSKNTKKPRKNIKKCFPTYNNLNNKFQSHLFFIAVFKKSGKGKNLLNKIVIEKEMGENHPSGILRYRKSPTVSKGLKGYLSSDTLLKVIIELEVDRVDVTYYFLIYLPSVCNIHRPRESVSRRV